jgi:hypothetical protein
MEIKPAGRFVKNGTPSYFGAAENYVGVRRQNSIKICTDCCIKILQIGIYWNVPWSEFTYMLQPDTIPTVLLRKQGHSFQKQWKLHLM